MESAKEVLHMVERLYGHHFHLQDEYFGGIAIDLTGQPLPQRTLAACLASDAVLLGAVGGPRWDSAKERPEKGLLALRKRTRCICECSPCNGRKCNCTFITIKKR